MAETLTPEQAAEAFAQATRWQDALIRRAEGLTWMVWAAVLPGLIMTMGFIGNQESYPAWALIVSWPPWVLLGYLVTHSLWRTLSVTRLNLEPPRLRSYIIKTLVILALVALLHFALRPENMAWPLGLIGAGWLAVALFARKLSSQGRRAASVGAATVVAAAIVLGAFAVPSATSMAVAAIVTGVVPAAVGAYQVFSG